MDVHSPDDFVPLSLVPPAAPSAGASHNPAERRAKRGVTPRSFLDFWSWPEEEEDRRRLDEEAQCPSQTGRVLCWRRKKQCANPDCSDPATGRPHKFSAQERDLWNCPVCRRDRHCRQSVALPNVGCHRHGGASLTGWNLPQTKTGEHSKHIHARETRENFERLLARDKMLSVEESIALLQAWLLEIVGQYGGGVSRALLKEMKENRRHYKQEMRRCHPDPLTLYTLDEELDQMIKEGSHPRQVMRDYGEIVDRLIRLMAAYDAHAEIERDTISADKAWAMLALVEDTFRMVIEMMVEVTDEDIAVLKAILHPADQPVPGATPDPDQQMWRMRNGVDTYWRDKGKTALIYASQRFQNLGSGSMSGGRGSRR